MNSGCDSDALLLAHVAESIARVREYTCGGRREFFKNHLVQDAVVRNLQTLSESTQRLSPHLKDEELAVPWRAIAGFRNALVHDYLGLDLDVIWSVVEEDLPQLADAVERMRARLARGREHRKP